MIHNLIFQVFLCRENKLESLISGKVEINLEIMKDYLLERRKMLECKVENSKSEMLMQILPFLLSLLSYIL